MNWGPYYDLVRREMQKPVVPVTEKQNDLVALLKELLEMNCFNDVKRACLQALMKYPRDVRLWRLLGVAFGMQDKPQDAGRAFLFALTVGGDDDITLANYITSRLDEGEIKGACKMIRRFFPRLSQEAKEIVLENVCMAIERGTITQHQIPKVLKNNLPIRSCYQERQGCLKTSI